MDPDKYLGKHPIAMDIEQMPETPNHNKGTHHRRAHSDTSFRFDDFLLFDPSDLDLSSLDLPSKPSNPTPPTAPIALDNCSDDSSSNNNAPKPKPLNHFRSLSVDSDFFDGLGLNSGAGDEKFGGKVATAAQGEKKGYHHRHSYSMDESFDVDSVLGDESKKAMAADKLAELSLIDPKRAKRILANRQSAARSKERKIKYANELERKVQTLQTEATTLSAQVTLLQRDTTGLTAENKELKLRLEAMDQQAQLRDALNEALKEEVQHLRMATGEISAMSNRALPPHFPAQPGLQHFGSHQMQQHQQQLHISRGSTNSQKVDGQTYPSFLDFNHRT
ncbi:hypothetical protein HS088_TW23G00365 [Tripterygium wilfordii]|uniref:BZIP domain-containing protein n=1 Tax=Tripterygium wilfordii TaxID=458696 RepID=A0A7J7BUX9_TRIWF|nr:transcription factor VIP1-like [Tripterygium wilfordii]KAF5725638.1 hypothetical protein HS088_TW23G00365 [Tripterygium wilfordii]